MDGGACVIELPPDFFVEKIAPALDDFPCQDFSVAGSRRPRWFEFQTPSRKKLSKPHALREREGDDAVFECGLRLRGAWFSQAAWEERSLPMPPCRLDDLVTREWTFLMAMTPSAEPLCKGCVHELERWESTALFRKAVAAGRLHLGSRAFVNISGIV